MIRIIEKTAIPVSGKNIHLTMKIAYQHPTCTPRPIMDGEWKRFYQEIYGAELGEEIYDHMISFTPKTREKKFLETKINDTDKLKKLFPNSTITEVWHGQYDINLCFEKITEEDYHFILDILHNNGFFFEVEGNSDKTIIKWDLKYPSGLARELWGG